MVTRPRPPWLVLFALTTSSCSDDGTNHDLIKLTGITPRTIEAGDTVQITGLGFAEGSPARVAFRGDVFRAGQTPQRGVEIVVRTRDTSKDTIGFVVNDELERAFCGASEAASHAAFRGTVTLAFAASPGSFAPVTGTLPNVTLEVVPRVASGEAERHKEQLARDALSFLGLGLVDQGATDCCVVATSQGRALMAGVKPGDRIEQFDGIPVRSVTDLVPAGRNRIATLSIRRGSSTLPVSRNLDVQGFRWAVPSELAPSLGVLAFVLGILFTSVTPLRRALTVGVRFVKRSAMPRPADSLRSACNQGIALVRSHLSDLPLPESAGFRITQVLAVMALGGLCGLMTTREELISSELDIVLLWLLSAVTVSVATLVSSVWCLKNRPLAGVTHAAQVIVHQLPVLALILVSIAISGSSRIAEIVRMQGPWPNSWLAFHDPAFAALSVAAIGSLIPLSDGVVALDVTSPEPIRRSMSISVAALLAFITNRMHLWLQSILLALLLFGGWAVDQEPASPVLKHGIGIVLPTLALLAKAWAITALLTGARALFCDIRLRHTTRRMLRYGLPSVVVLAALSLSWVWCLRRWSVNWADVAMRWAILGVSVAWFLAVAVRVRNNPRGAEKAALENHWI